MASRSIVHNCEMLVLVSVSDMAPLVWIFQCTVFSSVSVILYTPLFPLQYQHISGNSHTPHSALLSLTIVYLSIPWEELLWGRLS